MNIFILSWIIEECARFHCDSHCVKMILETSQILSTCWHAVNPVEASVLLEENKIYRKTHINHPCCIWVRECKENYIWLCHLGIALCREYAFRYNKKLTDHKCYAKLYFFIHNIPPNLKGNKTNPGNITKPKLAMPDTYKSDDAVYSYRKYYLNEKSHLFKWKNRPKPYWIPVD